MTTDFRGRPQPKWDYEEAKDILRYEDGAYRVLSDLDHYGPAPRQRNFTTEQIVAYCRNMAEQRARRAGHDTGCER